MDRRSFLQIAGATAVAGGSITGDLTHADGADAAPPAVPSFVQSAWPSSDPFLGPLASRLERRIVDAGLSRLRDRTFGPTRLTPVDAIPELGDTAALVAPWPASFGLAPDDHCAWLTVGGGQTLLDAVASDRGAKCIPVAYTGAGGGLWTRSEIVDPRDLQAMRISADGWAARVALAFGARVSPLDREPATGLHEARIDAVEAPTLAYALLWKLPAASTHWYAPGFDTNGGLIVAHIGIDDWHRMTLPEQTGLEALAALELQLSLSELRTHDGLLRRQMMAAPRPVPARFDGTLRAALERMTADIADGIATTGHLPRLVHDSVTAFGSIVGAGRMPAAIS